MISRFVVVFMILGFLGIANCAEWTARFKIFEGIYLKDAFMNCKIDGAFVGFYNQTGVKIVNSNKYTIKDDISDKTIKILDIIRVEESDYGEYTCKDATSEDKAKLEIKVTLIKPQSPQSLAVGFEGKINAEAYGMPRKDIKWYHKDIVIASLKADGTMIGNQDRYTIENRGALVIKDVKDTDSGNYKIQVTLQSARLEEIVNIITGNKPEITTAPQASYTKTAGQTLKIACAWKFGDSKIKWSFANRKGVVSVIDAGKFDETGYTIQSISASDEGNYTCSESNKFGDSRVNTEIALVITPASITTNFKEMKVEINKAFDVSCEADGVPAPTVTIYQGVKSVATGVGSANISKTMSVEYTGSYNCTADNGATDKDGKSISVEKSMELIMLTPPSIDRTNTTKSIISAVGHAYEFVCAASGNPIPKISVLQGGKEVSTILIVTDGVAKATYKVMSAGNDDFGNITCNVENNYGKDNVTVILKKVVKAIAPRGLQISGDAGLKYIDLKWDNVNNADKYIVYVNETREEESTENRITIKNLLQNANYSFKVSSVNLAGVGNASAPVLIKTSDITPPSKVNNIVVASIKSESAEVNWDQPANVEGLDITYRVRYCEMNNITKVNCENTPEKKDSSATLLKLNGGTEYTVEVVAVNQGVLGTPSEASFTTKKFVATMAPLPVGKKEGMSAGAIAGIIIAIILIILLVVDLFCCFFNHCGFSHCCVETFCSSKSKYMPADSKEASDEKAELKPKAENVV